MEKRADLLLQEVVDVQLPSRFRLFMTHGLPQAKPLCPHHLLKFAQVHVYCIGDTIQPSHPLIPSSPSALNLFQQQGLFL